MGVIDFKCVLPCVDDMVNDMFHAHPILGLGEEKWP